MSETGGAKLETRLAAVTSRPGGFAVGVDVGGSKVAAGHVDSRGEILWQTRVAMVSNGTASEGLNALVSAIDSLCASCSIDLRTNTQLFGIGICAPGPLDPKNGVIVNPPNLPCWRNFPLAAQIANIYRVPVRVENDANAAALAEAHWGGSHSGQHNAHHHRSDYRSWRDPSVVGREMGSGATHCVSLDHYNSCFRSGGGADFLHHPAGLSRCLGSWLLSRLLLDKTW